MFLHQLRNIIGADKFDDLTYSLDHSKPSIAIGLSLSLNHSLICQNCGISRIFRYFCHYCGYIINHDWKVSINCKNIKSHYNSNEIEETSLRGLTYFYECTFEKEALEQYGGDMLLLLRNIAICAVGRVGRVARRFLRELFGSMKRLFPNMSVEAPSGNSFCN
eukprot:gene12070-25308_t